MAHEDVCSTVRMAPCHCCTRRTAPVQEFATRGPGTVALLLLLLLVLIIIITCGRA